MSAPFSNGKKMQLGRTGFLHCLQLTTPQSALSHLNNFSPSLSMITLIFTKRTLFQILQPSRLDFLSLLDALVERKEFCGEEAAEFGLGEGEFAPGLVHAEDGRVM